MEYSLALSKSRRAGAITERRRETPHEDGRDHSSGSESETQSNGDDNSHNDRPRNIQIPSQDDANIALLQGAAAAILILIVVYTVSAIGVAIPTQNMDRRADAIVVGMGRILSAFLFAYFSVEIPKWLGATYSSQRANYYKQQVSHTHGLKELSFRVCWSILGHFFMVYSIVLLYFTKPTRWSIQISTAIGIVFGFGVVWAVYIGRTKFKHHKTLIAFVSSFIIMVSSAAAFSAGCWYIKEVWYEEDIGYQEEYTLITFFGWLALVMGANFLYYGLTRRKLKAARTDGNSTIVGAASAAVAADADDARSTWRYQSQVFQPPESVCFAATKLSKATAHVAVATVSSPFKRAGSTLSRIRANSFGSTSKGRSPQDEDGIAALDTNALPRRRAASADAGTIEPLPQPNPNRVRTNTEPTLLGTSSVTSTSNNRARSLTETSYSSSAYNLESPVASLKGSPSNSLEASFHQSSNYPLDTIKTGVALSFGEDLTDSKHAVSFESSDHDMSALGGDLDLPNGPSLDVEEAIVCHVEEDNVEEHSAVAEREPTLWFMIRTNSCCGKRQHYKAPPRKRWERVLNFVKWTLWGITSAMHLYFLIICIGATTQQDRVRRALPRTFKLLYPPDYTVSTMCAWNESSPFADIRTFDSLDAVLEANYTVVHCGACGACSNWDDLSLQWTTRTNLASLGQEWYVEECSLMLKFSPFAPNMFVHLALTSFQC
jgi:multidrug transporter EmrE-like cation transporter